MNRLNLTEAKKECKVSVCFQQPFFAFPRSQPPETPKNTAQNYLVTICHNLSRPFVTNYFQISPGIPAPYKSKFNLSHYFGGSVDPIRV